MGPNDATSSERSQHEGTMDIVSSAGARKVAPYRTARATPSPSIDITQDQKVLVLGDFQTGKTTLARWLMAQFPRAILCDTTWTIPGGVHDFSQLNFQWWQYQKAVFQPTDMEREFESFCLFALDKTNAMVFIDEPWMAMGSHATIPPSFNALYRLGHKRGLGVMLATHRYHGDLPALTRIVHHIFCFRMSVDSDIQAISDNFGSEMGEWARQAPDYHFWYRGPGGHVSGPMQPLPLFRTGAKPPPGPKVSPERPVPPQRAPQPGKTETI